QKRWNKDVAWLSVISSAPGKQGAVSDADENAYLKKMDASPTAVLMDSKSEIAKAYQAKTTPQMVIIDKKGFIIYDGAIDDKPSTNEADVAKAKNYVNTALEEAVVEHKAVTTKATEPYGCPIKYE